MPFHVRYLDQFLPLSAPAREVTIVWIVDVVFLDTVVFVEPELAIHLGLSIARRENLEDHLRSDAGFLPLLV